MLVITAELLNRSMIEFKNSMDKLSVVPQKEQEYMWRGMDICKSTAYKFCRKDDPDKWEAIILPELGLMQIYIDNVNVLAHSDVGEIISYTPSTQQGNITLRLFVHEIIDETDDSTLKLIVASNSYFKGEKKE